MMEYKKETEESMKTAEKLYPHNAQIWHYGFAKGLDIAVGFAGYLRECLPKRGGWEIIDEIPHEIYTTEQLLSKYLTEINKK